MDKKMHLTNNLNGFSFESLTHMLDASFKEITGESIKLDICIGPDLPEAVRVRTELYEQYNDYYRKYCNPQDYIDNSTTIIFNLYSKKRIIGSVETGRLSNFTRFFLKGKVDCNERDLEIRRLVLHREQKNKALIHGIIMCAIIYKLLTSNSVKYFFYTRKAIFKKASSYNHTIISKDFKLPLATENYILASGELYSTYKYFSKKSPTLDKLKGFI